MQLRTAQGIRDAEKQIAEVTAKEERSNIGKKISVTVQWNSFTDDPKYMALELDQKTQVFRNIANQMDTLLSGSYGYVPLSSGGETIFR